MNKIEKFTTGKNLVYGAALLSALLIFLVAIPIGETHWSVDFIGRFHPLFVHIPIGVLLGLFLLEFLNLLRPSLQLKPACNILLWFAIISAVPTIIAGKFLAVSGGYGSQTLVIHKWFGLFTVILSIWLLVLRQQTKASSLSKFTNYHKALLLNVFILGLTGHYGGSLTHGTNYLTESLPPELKSLFGDDPYELDGIVAMEASLVDQTLNSYDFAKDIEPITKTYCISCHNEEKQKGGLRLDNIDPDLVYGKDAETWRAMLNMINTGEMPPKEEDQLKDEERTVLVDWITASIHYAVEVKKSEETGVIRRLTRNQYTNSLNKILNVSIRFGDVLPEDGKSEMGFSNNGNVLQVSPLHIEYFKQIAREALDKAIAPPEKPTVTHYRITFGKGIGVGKVSAMIGGYQSAPINSDDFTVEILDEDGKPKTGLDSLEEAHLTEIKMNIGVGMRGSDADRYEVVDEGIMLYSALPHKEVTPKSWQGPSPNLKLLFRNYFPMNGDFKFRVKASKGYQWYSQKEGFIALRNKKPVKGIREVINLEAKNCKETANLQLKNDFLIPKEVTGESIAKYKFIAPKEGYYQIDFAHPYVADDGMPSMTLKVDKHKIQERLHFDKSLESTKELITQVTLAFLKAGEHTLEIGGNFFVGFSKVTVTPFPEDHPISIQLKSEAEQSRAKYDNDVPVIRAFAGARTDDGMDYKTFDNFQNVTAKIGEPDTYTFKGRLENLPIPVIDTVETEILANIMILGLWNDYLVKDNQDSGPPLLIKSLEFEAPFYPNWPPESHEKIFFTSPDKDNKELYTKQVLKKFIEEAYRRPMADKDIEPYMKFWNNIKGDYDRYEDGVKEVLVAVLCSPNFIYLAEPESDASEDEKEFFLASRLSYFLWNSPPDEELIELAEDGDLHETSTLKDQVNRMLQDEKSWRMIETFAEEWLRIDRHKAMSVNVNEYEDFTRFVKQDMANETNHFIHHVLKENLSIFNLIESDFAMLNQNLAEFYGIEGVKGSYFRPVAITSEMHRGGLLSQGAFLSGHSDGTQAHAIKRAVWLRSKILGSPPPPPPPNVPELDPETPGFEQLTLKEQLFIHRNSPSCMDCHKKIDPYGIAFENYNAVGRFETMAKEKPIDTKAELPNGHEVDGIDEIKKYILEMKSEDFTRSLVKYLYAYALGRDVTFVDEEEIESIVRKVREDDYQFQSIFENIVTSPSFKGEFKSKTLWGRNL
ncbi:DUF1592 domain-containing protein [Chondrinema litorale]|uniref:DUF1592 domain-containing protein n=1 Tax=Chondrinema litorale TaxID=2994555 RepID=UPI0025435297|nr:DUF1592 domain-containing protein [Chondrinema litorale]UZR97422.1 DUF1592 domain-containing protein [Chondrinema litorale]